MNRFGLGMSILCVLGAGCRSGVDAPPANALVKSSPAAEAKTAVGKWTKAFDNGTHLDLEIEPTYVKFCLPGSWALTGSCRPNGQGGLTGVITSIKWEGQADNFHFNVELDYEYTLWYRRDGKRLIVTRLDGDCFANGGEANCSGTYEPLMWLVNADNQGERVESATVSPAHFETWTIGDSNGFHMSIGKVAEQSASPFGPPTSGPPAFGSGGTFGNATH